MYSRACVKQSGVLNEAELSIACEGSGMSEKDGLKRRLNRGGGTENLTRCSWVCWSCKQSRDGCCVIRYARPGPRARVWQVRSRDGFVGATRLWCVHRHGKVDALECAGNLIRDHLLGIAEFNVARARSPCSVKKIYHQSEKKNSRSSGLFVFESGWGRSSSKPWP